jgi:hypothetical protein
MTEVSEWIWERVVDTVWVCCVTFVHMVGWWESGYVGGDAYSSPLFIFFSIIALSAVLNNPVYRQAISIWAFTLFSEYLWLKNRLYV